VVLPRDYVDINCSIARCLEVVGDRWTLMILRNALVGQTRFDQFQTSLGVARNVLADRLGRLTEEGLLQRLPYQQRPVRHEYQVTDKGRALWPALIALLEWGDRYHAPDGPPRLITHARCGGSIELQLYCPTCQTGVDPDDIATQPGPGSTVPPRTVGILADR
jgi:DNA-binding HxlR family transcriptional regulator